MFPDDPFKKINDMLQEAVRPLNEGIQDAEANMNKAKTVINNFLTGQEQKSNE